MYFHTWSFNLVDWLSPFGLIDKLLFQSLRAKGDKMRSVDENFYKTSAWKSTRSSYIKKANGLCERCLSKGLIVSGKIVHHKIHLTSENVLQPEVSLNFDNLELLCHACHNEEHFGKKNNTRYRFDGEGNMIF